MSPMSQQMNPAVLTSILSDPRAQPAQRMAAMSMLKQLQGGANSPMAAPQGDGTGAMDMDPSFVRAVQQEMKNEQAPQGLPPAQGQQMDQGPQDAGVQGDIAAGVKAASGFAQGGAVRGYAKGGDAVSDYQAKLKKLARLTGINDPIALKAKMDELEEKANPGFFKNFVSGIGMPQQRQKTLSVDEQMAELEAAPVRQQQAADAEAAKALPYIRATQTPVGVVNPNELDLAPQPAAIAAQVAAAQAPIPIATVQQRAAAAVAPKPQPQQPPAVVAAAPAVAAPVDDGGYAERMKKLLDDDEGDMTPREKSMALIQAGAAMMAGASKPGATFLGSAGEGLTKGLEGFNAARSERAVKRMKQAALLQAERQAGIENTQRDKGIALQGESNQLARERALWEKDPANPDNKFKGVQSAYYASQTGKPSTVGELLIESKRIAAMPPGPEKDSAIQAFNMARGTGNQQTPNSRQRAKLIDVESKARTEFRQKLKEDFNSLSKPQAQKDAEEDAYVQKRINSAKAIMGLSDDPASPGAVSLYDLED